MTIMLGNADITNVRLGSTKVDKVMLGEQLVWPTETTTPFTLGAIHWLPFTNSPTEDIGTAPVVWNTYQSPTVSDGALVTGRVRFPTNTTYNPLNGSAVTGWMNVQSPPSYFAAKTLSATANYSELAVATKSGGNLRFGFRRGAGAMQEVVTGVATPGTWVFVAVMMEPTGTGDIWRYRAYINDVEVVNSTYDAGTQGSAPYPSAEFDADRALLDEAAVYNRALTASEVASLVAAGRS